MNETLTDTPQTPTDGKTAANEAPKTGGMVDKTTSTSAESKTSTTDKPGLLDDGEKKSAAEVKTPTAPEKYELKLEGDTKLSPSVQTAFEAAAKEAQLTNESANKMLNSLVKAVQESTKQQQESLVSTWADALSTHKTLGGEKLDENLAIARKALKEFGSDELQSLLRDTGLQHNPAIVELLWKVGKAVGDDKIVTGAPPASEESDVAKLFYPSMA